MVVKMLRGHTYLPKAMQGYRPMGMIRLLKNELHTSPTIYFKENLFSGRAKSKADVIQ